MSVATGNQGLWGRPFGFGPQPSALGRIITNDSPGQVLSEDFVTTPYGRILPRSRWSVYILSSG